MSKKQKESLGDLLLRKEKEGKVITVDCEGGLQETDLNEFITQPTEGILYDLNRDKVTCLTWLNMDKARLWINNYAVAVVIEKLKEYYDKYQDLLKKYGEK